MVAAWSQGGWKRREMSIWRRPASTPSTPCLSLSQGPKRNQPGALAVHPLYSGAALAVLTAGIGWRRSLAAVGTITVYQLAGESSFELRGFFSAKFDLPCVENPLPCSLPPACLCSQHSWTPGGPSRSQDGANWWGKVSDLGLGWAQHTQPEIFPELVPWSYIPLLTLNLLHGSVFWFGSCLWARVPTSVSPAVTDPWLCLQVPLTGMRTHSHFFSFHARGQPSPDSIGLLRLPGVSLLQMSFLIFFSRIRIGEELMNLWPLNHNFAPVLSFTRPESPSREEKKRKKNCSGGSQAKPLVSPNHREIILVPALQLILFSAFEASACVIINLD